MAMSCFSKLSPTAIILAITGCASLPNGPNVMVLPGTGTSFEHFRSDDALCEKYALSQVKGAEDSDSEQEVQERYDVAYVQCMYAKGQRVPVSGPFSDIVHHSTISPSAHVPPPPSGTPPPPPAN
jgi:hypothetical protein